MTDSYSTNPDINTLMSQMNLAEKVGQLFVLSAHDVVIAKKWIEVKHIGSFINLLGEQTQELQAVASQSVHKIPLLMCIDAVHGHAFWEGATVFPSQLGLSSTWNADLMRQVGEVTAKEMVATGVHWNFSPVLDMARDLRWGRIGETFGEDPLLIQTFAAAMLEGYQGQGLHHPESVLACAKHFLGYSETVGGRDSSEGEHTERKLRGLYLPSFQHLIEQGCLSIMVGYHAIDGTPCTINKWLLTDLMRDELGYKGVFVTDWDNVERLHTEQMVCASIKEAVRLALEAGVDLIMGTEDYTDIVCDLVQTGQLSSDIINAACARVLDIKWQLGLFDERRTTDIADLAPIIRSEQHRELALEAAYQSCVLLKNEERTLPIGDKIRRIAVIGANANDPEAQLGDWVLGTFPFHVGAQPDENITTILDGIQQRAGQSLDVKYLKGCEVDATNVSDPEEVTELAKWADMVILVLGDTLAQNGEMCDRADLDLSAGQLELCQLISDTQTPLVTVLINGKPLSIPEVAQQSDALLEAWNPGAKGGQAVAQILFGDRPPVGRLSISFPYHVGQLPVYYNQLPGWHGTPPKYIDLPNEPLFPFGYGLTYTTFEYTNLRVTEVSDGLKVQVDVANSGEQSGTEVVQVYINDVYTSVTTPVKQLVGYQRVLLAVGECKQVEFHIDKCALQLFTAQGQWEFEAGEFEVMVGGSSSDADLHKQRIYLD